MYKVLVVCTHFFVLLPFSLVDMKWLYAVTLLVVFGTCKLSCQASCSIRTSVCALIALYVYIPTVG